MKQKNILLQLFFCCAATILFSGTTLSALSVKDVFHGTFISDSDSEIICESEIDPAVSGSAVITHCSKGKNQNQFRRGENIIPTPFILSGSSYAGCRKYFPGQVNDLPLKRDNAANPVRAGPEK